MILTQRERKWTFHNVHLYEMLVDRGSGTHLYVCCYKPECGSEQQVCSGIWNMHIRLDVVMLLPKLWLAGPYVNLLNFVVAFWWVESSVFV